MTTTTTTRGEVEHWGGGALSRWGWLTQADLYKSLDVLAVFVSDGKLGSTGVTLALLEVLWLCGLH